MDAFESSSVPPVGHSQHAQATDHTQQVKQGMSDHILALVKENAVLKSNIYTIREDLIVAAQTSIGRMLIEVSIAANDLRESLPPDCHVEVEVEREEGELVWEQEASMNRWKARLGKMILRISKAHWKAEQELKAVDDKVTGMMSSMENGNYLRPEKVHMGCWSEEEGPVACGLKRAWSSKVQLEDIEECGGLAKRARIEEELPQVHSMQPPLIGRAKTIHQRRLPLQEVRPAQLNAQAMDEIIVVDGIKMNAERQKLLIRGVKVEEEEVKTGAPKYLRALEQYRPPAPVYKSWKVPFQNSNLNEEEAMFIHKSKEYWSHGGWSDRGQWVAAVMKEYRNYKNYASSATEANACIENLFLRIRAHKFNTADKV